MVSEILKYKKAQTALAKLPAMSSRTRDYVEPSKVAGSYVETDAMSHFVAALLLLVISSRAFEDIVGSHPIFSSLTTGKVCEDPLSLDRYEYARDNPEAITDPSGHDWWSSATSFVSNVASTVSSDVQSVASAADNAWNSMSPNEQQAFEVTAVVAVAAVVVVATGGAGIIAVPSIVSYGLGSAAISSGIYTLTSGQDATPAGALGAALAGGLSAGVGAGVAGADLGAFSSLALVFGGTAGSDILGSDVTGAISGTSPNVDPTEVVFNAGFSAATFGFGGRLADDAGFSSVGRPATKMTTLVDSFFNPADHPHAAWQVYSGLFNAGISAGGQAAARYFSPIFNHLIRETQ